MTRPIIWAVGTFVAISSAASMASGKLSRLALAGPSTQTRPASPASAAEFGRAPTSAGDRVVVLQSDWQGHYTAHISVEGQSIRMMVDTGATVVALSHEDAVAAGIRPSPRDYRARMSTANGEVAAARVRIRELRVGDIQVRDVDAVVMPRGVLRGSLLGMSFLRQLRGFEFASGRLTLRG